MAEENLEKIAREIARNIAKNIVEITEGFKNPHQHEPTKTKARKYLVAECGFCNIGEEEKRGIYVISTPNNCPTCKTSKHYECGVGKDNCSVLQAYEHSRQRHL